MIGLIDTNLFKKLTKNVDAIHENFVRTLDDQIYSTAWVVTPFGLLEYLGLALRGALQIEDMPDGWTPPESVCIQYAASINALGLDYLSHTYWVRSKAKEKFTEQLTEAVLKARAADEEKYHSQEFTNGHLAYPLFRKPLARYPAEDIAELLSIDFLHRYHNFPSSIMPTIRQVHRSALLAEYFREKRNIALVRGSSRHGTRA